MAEEAVALAERTDSLVDHGDACLALATVLQIAGDGAGARAAAQEAVGLYELKGAAALAEKARSMLGAEPPAAPAAPETPNDEPGNACVRAVTCLDAAIASEAWDEIEQLLASDASVESRRKIVGFPRVDLGSIEQTREATGYREQFPKRHRRVVVAVRGERLALTRVELRTADESLGAPKDEMLQLFGLDDVGRIALSVWFDVEDIDAAVAELDAAHVRLEERHPRAPLENAATRVDSQLSGLFFDRRWEEMGALYGDDILLDDRRKGLRRESTDRATQVDNVRAIAALGVVNVTQTPLALRGDRLCLSHVRYEIGDTRPVAFDIETLAITEVDAAGLMVARVVLDPDDLGAAFEELDARFLAGEAAAHAHTWSLVASTSAGFNRHELAATTPNLVDIDHRRAAAFEPGNLKAYIHAGWDVDQGSTTYIEAVHRLSNLGTVVTYAGACNLP